MRSHLRRTFHRSYRAVARNLNGAIGISLLTVVLLFAFGGTLLELGGDSLQQNLRARLLEPGSTVGTQTYYFGSDRLGRDVLSRVIHGTRVSLSTAFIGSSLAALIG